MGLFQHLVSEVAHKNTRMIVGMNNIKISQKREGSERENKVS